MFKKTLALLVLLAASAPAQQITQLVLDPWPEVLASGGDASGFIPDPMPHESGRLYPQRIISQGNAPPPGPIPWFRPGERVFKAPDDRPDRLLLAARTSLPLTKWLWTTSAPTSTSDHRYAKALEMWRNGPKSAQAYGRKLARPENRPRWAKHWIPWRTEGWMPWAGGDAPCHYDAPMWWLQAAQDGDPDAAQAFRRHIAHVLSVGFDWQIGEMRYEKSTSYTGDFYKPGRTPWSHQWTAPILAAAHLTGHDPEEPVTQATRLIASNVLARPPPMQAKWGVRIVAHYLRTLRAFHVFAPHVLETEEIARAVILDMLLEAKHIDGKPRYWENDGPTEPQPHTVDCWQDWLMLCEIAEWAVIWEDRDLLHRLKPIVDWHLANTTQTNLPGVIYVGYSLPLPGPWAQDARATTPYHTTYAIPILFGMSKLYGEPYTKHHKRAWNAVMTELERIDFDYGSPTLGPAGPKQNNRAFQGLRPDFAPGR